MCIIEKANKYLNDVGMAPLSEKEEIIQEASKTLWESQKLLETAEKIIDCKERKKEASGTKRLSRPRRQKK